MKRLTALRWAGTMTGRARLWGAGTLGLPDVVEPAPVKGFVMEDHQFTVHLEVDGAPGPWTYHRTLPYRSGFDPTLRPAVDAVKALIRAVEALD